MQSAILEPVRSVLLSDEAVETFCPGRERTRPHVDRRGALPGRGTRRPGVSGTRPARSATLAPVIKELRQKQYSLRRGAARGKRISARTRSPAEREYRAAVADINRALRGGSVEAARGALRGLIGEIAVFQTGNTLAARLTMRPGGLLRNPGSVLFVGSGGLLC